jgi:hypothetical protein
MLRGRGVWKKKKKGERGCVCETKSTLKKEKKKVEREEEKKNSIN